MSSDAFIFILLALATYRATRLVVDDEFPPIKTVRDRIVRAAVPTGRGHAVREALADLVTCRYCASGWVALGAAFAVNYAAQLDLGWVLGALWWFGTWGLAVALYNTFEQDDDGGWTDVEAAISAAVSAAVERSVPVVATAVLSATNERVATTTPRDHNDDLRTVIARLPITDRARLVATALRELNGDELADTGTLPNG